VKNNKIDCRSKNGFRGLNKGANMKEKEVSKNCVKVLKTLPNNKKTCIILRHHHWRKMVEALIKEQQKQR
jgi:hypothetical protein